MEDPRNIIDSYRNPLKRGYAASFYEHLRNGTPEPERPEGLSYMAAHAVRMTVDEAFRNLLNADEEPTEKWPCGCVKGATPHGAGWSDCHSKKV